MKGKFFSYEQLKRKVDDDAINLFMLGYTFGNITVSDIIAGYPEGYFSDEETDEHGVNQDFRTAEEIAELTLANLYSSIVIHAGESYYLTECTDYQTDCNGIDWCCGKAITRKGKDYTIYWVVQS